eukprot:gene6518-19896_t
MTWERRQHANEECAAMLKLAEHTAKSSVHLLDDFARAEDRTCGQYREMIANDKAALAKLPEDDQMHVSTKKQLQRVEATLETRRMQGAAAREWLECLQLVWSALLRRPDLVARPAD